MLVFEELISHGCTWNLWIGIHLVDLSNTIIANMQACEKNKRKEFQSVNDDIKLTIR